MSVTRRVYSSIAALVVAVTAVTAGATIGVTVTGARAASPSCGSSCVDGSPLPKGCSDYLDCPSPTAPAPSWNSTPTNAATTLP